MAGLTTTQTFSDGDTVTAAKLNNIVSNCSIDADAVTTAKILNANVTLAKMATNSVDTDQLVADSVQNSKLNDMAAKTVKANATNASANPTDFPIITSQLLAGTSDALKAVTFTTDLEMVDSSDAIVTNNTASKIRVADALINGKSTATVVPANDTVLVYDADGTGTSKLRKTTVENMMQTLPALTTTSGVVRLATQERAIDPSTSGTVDADVITVNQSGSMLAKAWAKLSYNKTGTEDDGTLTVKASFNLDTPTHDFASYRGLITFPIATDLNGSVADYCIMAHAHYLDGSTSKACVCEVTLDTNASFTIQFKDYAGGLKNPAHINLVIFA